jgi:hypothetical protein
VLCSNEVHEFFRFFPVFLSKVSGTSKASRITEDGASATTAAAEDEHGSFFLL